jgi:hypothetical protein
MDVKLPSLDTVFCDWLDVTFSPEAFDYTEFCMSVCNLYPHIAEKPHKDHDSHLLLIGGGTLLVSFKKTFIRMSFSGGALSELRETNCYLPFLGWLSDYPHRVTRIDVSMDKAKSGGHVVADLWNRYREGVSIGQRSLSTSTITAVDDRNRTTGTFYAGYRSKATRTFKVYDKRWELFSKRGVMIDDRTRYEFTMRGGKSSTHAKPSLRDAALPESLFWDMASPILKAPKDVSPWIDTSMTPWTFERPESLTVWQKLCALLESSPDIARVNAYALELGEPGLKMVLSAVSKGVVKSDSTPLGGQQ